MTKTDSSLNQQTYERIRRDIMTFSLKPGEPVSAAKLALRYEVSRTPAREALVRLQSEGVVEIFPKSKSVIAKINVRIARQEWFLRKTLEMGMVDDFFDRLTDVDVQDMEKYYNLQMGAARKDKTPQSSYEYLLSDNAFHAVTYRVAGQDLAARVIEDTMAHYARARLLIDVMGEQKDRTVSDHKQLIAYVKNRDREGYRTCLKRHLGYMQEDLELVEKRYPDFFEEGWYEK